MQYPYPHTQFQPELRFSISTTISICTSDACFDCIFILDDEVPVPTRRASIVECA